MVCAGQHNPFIPAGRDGLCGYIEKLPAERRYETGNALAQRELVRVHGRYSGGDRKDPYRAGMRNMNGNLSWIGVIWQDRSNINRPRKLTFPSFAIW
jgi:hypothetical protein